MKLNYQNFFFDKIPFYLTFLIPIFLVSGPFLSDLAISICAVIFLINSCKNNLISYYKNIFFYIFIIFYIYLNISALFSSNVLFSLKTSLPYLRFGIFALSMWYLLNKNDQLLKYLFYCFLFVILFLEIDGIYQYINFHNLFHYPLLYNRVSSFFGDELILGSFLSRNYPLFLALFFFYLKKNEMSKKIILIFIIVLIFIPVLVFISGERSSFFFIILSIIFFFLFFNKKIYYVPFLISIFLIVIGIFFLENRFSERIIKETKFQLTFKTEEKKLFNAFSVIHEGHYSSALRIFKDNIFLGAGPRSFRLKCSEEKYLVSTTSCSTHPHNTYIQLLSETGLMGFLFIFSIFIFLCLKCTKMIYYKFILKNDIDPVKVCLMASFLITLWPIIPTGNFFHNWLNVIFYLPVGFFIWIIEKEKSEKKL
jgi:O-antigen ligase